MLKRGIRNELSDQKTHEQIPDSLRQVLAQIFRVNLLLTILKLAIVFPDYLDSPVLLTICILGIIGSVTILVLLLRRPDLLVPLTQAALLLFFLYVTYILFLVPNSINFITIQHIFIIIMWAFYGLNRRWGIGYSAIFILTISGYLFYSQSALVSVRLLPTTMSFFAAFACITINFILVAITHFFYHRALINTVKEKTELNKKLNKLLDAKTDFLSTMSHELRTPLNSVIGMTNLLADNNQDADQKENLDNLRFSAESLLLLINDILDFNKMDSHKLELEAIPFNLPVLLENVCGGLRAKTREKNLQFDLRIDTALSAVDLLGDPTRLTQIIFNLAGNAIKFTETGGVTVKAEQLAETSDHLTVRFSIIDTGIGIHENQQEVIFEPFIQASRNISRKFGGTGLGLSIVKHLVNLHGSTIQLESTPGMGSRFHFSIQYQKYHRAFNTQASLSTASSTISKQSLHGLRVLLAEDNQMSVVFMKKLFAKWEIDLDIALNGQEAVDMAKKQVYDVILMDLHMPVMNGIDATGQIRSMETPGCQTYILALTASVSDDVIANIRLFGFDDYLGKPFRPNDLHHKLEKVLRK